jgi:hypothetical protein
VKARKRKKIIIYFYHSQLLFSLRYNGKSGGERQVKSDDNADCNAFCFSLELLGEKLLHDSIVAGGECFVVHVKCFMAGKF